MPTLPRYVPISWQRLAAEGPRSSQVKSIVNEEHCECSIPEMESHDFGKPGRSGNKVKTGQRHASWQQCFTFYGPWSFVQMQIDNLIGCSKTFVLCDVHISSLSYQHVASCEGFLLSCTFSICFGGRRGKLLAFFHFSISSYSQLWHMFLSLYCFLVKTRW